MTGNAMCAIDQRADGRLIDIVEEGFDASIRFGDVVPRDNA